MKLATLLEERGVPFEITTHPAAYTAQGLAAEEHVSGYAVAKPVVVKTRAGFVMCVLPACARLDLETLRHALKDDRLRLATEAEMAGVFPDCELGAEPPLGDIFGMETIMDDSLQGEESLLFQAGTHTEAVKLRRTDYVKAAHPQVESIARYW
ncbi:MAG: YbaK/EbsC family protein [bacterium]|nr:YbaK/EbsC family protein [bacterium]